MAAQQKPPTRVGGGEATEENDMRIAFAIEQGMDIAPGCSCGGYVPTDMADEIAAFSTADGYPITQGMRVFTNNLDRGVVDLEHASLEHNQNNHRNALWFDVHVDTNYKGEAVESSGRGVLQSDDRVAVRYNGKRA